MSADAGPELSIATICLSGMLTDKLDAIADAGFRGIELFETDLIASPLSPPEVEQRCTALGMSITQFQALRDFEGVTGDRFAANIRRAGFKFDVAQELGTDTIGVWSSVAADTVDDDELVAEQLRQLAELASRNGLRISYEALAWGRHVNTWEHAFRIVMLADHPALGLGLDSFQFYTGNGHHDDIARVPGDKLFSVQFSDVHALNRHSLEWNRHNRLFPGQGSLPLPDLLARVRETGYRGPVSVQVFNDVFRQSAPMKSAHDAMRSMQWLTEEAARRPARPDAASSNYPPNPEFAGFGFAELSVGSHAAGLITETLSSMGFALVARHRTKPVDLWQQHDVCILVNGSVVAGHQPMKAELSAYSLRTEDPWGAYGRARDFDATIARRNQLPDEADLAGVESPDGLAVFFGTDPAEEWLTDFVPVAPTPGARSVGVSVIDHLAIGQSFDSYDEAALFMRAVLGMECDPEEQFAAPYGLMRSRMAENHDHSVRIVLLATLLRRGTWAPGVPDPQRIAFRCDDIFSTAARLRRNGAPMLRIPDNYYDDLDARVDMDIELRHRMRDFDIMFDSDDDGEYFHMCTPVLGTRIYFEFVQRVGGYRGTAARNAPVRMAAHRAQRQSAQV